MEKDINKNFWVQIMSRNLWISVIGGLIVAALLAGGGWAWTEYIGSVPKETLITSPSDGATVDHTVSVSGTYAESEANKDLWLLVQPVKFPQFHPQNAPLLKQRNQSWTSSAYVGLSQEQNTGEEFIIHLVVAEQTASGVFKKYLEDAAKLKEWSGLETLPSSATIARSIRVRRN